MNRYTLLVLIILLNGCGQYSIRNIDKPLPEDYETWEKPNHSVLQIKKALLECGAIAPSTVGWNSSLAEEKIGVLGEDNQMNSYFQTSKCMENAGYKRKWGMRSAQKGCDDGNFPERKSYPACQSNAVIPTPSVERRLNSWYCKVKSDYNYCLKYTLNPNPEVSCSRPDKLIPVECLADGQTQSPISNTGASSQSKQKYHTYIPPDRSQEQANQLQRDTQNQNNRRMNELLKNTSPKIKR